MERKLVSIQRIEETAPIAGADRILRARVLGWDVVVKRGELAAGDRCVFFEIDCVLPVDRAWSEFMRPRNFRVKTARLRGVLSQGLALPVSILDGDVPAIGDDVTDRLGVTKFEPVRPDSREIAAPFPGEVPKTDEIRLQSVLGVLDELRGDDFVVTTKLDGQSARAFCAEHGLATVPVERVVTGDDAAGFDHSLEAYLALALGTYPGTRNRKEGIVVRPLRERTSAVLGGRLSFKVINNEFLLSDEQ